MKKPIEERPILDACCGSRMFWFDRENPDVVFMDNRELETTLCDGRSLVIKPDVIGDFRHMDFPDESFNLVVFDPPHLLKGGEKSWIIQKYGKLDEKNWQEDLHQGFLECFRVLKPYGVLIFKWNTYDIPFTQIQELFPANPLMGSVRDKTWFVVFMKGVSEKSQLVLF